MKQFYIILFSITLLNIPAAAQVDLSRGLVAYYPLNGNANDVSGNNLHGKMLNGIRGTTDRNGIANAAMTFDGIDDYIEVADDPKLRFSEQFTITFYFNRAPEATTAELVEKRRWTDGAMSSFDIGLIDKGQIRTAVKTGNNCSSPNAGWIYPTESDVTMPNVWYCVAAVFNKGKLDFYFNGSLVSSFVGSFNAMDLCQGGEMRFGMHLSFHNLPFKGSMDEIRIYNRPLNVQEIQSLCELPNPSVLCNGTLGAPLAKTDFGAGPGKQISLNLNTPGTESDFEFVKLPDNGVSNFPAIGRYTIINKTPNHPDWFVANVDHTGDKPNGNFLVVNAGKEEGVLFKQTVSGLCGSRTYEFAAWIANLMDPSKNNGMRPDVSLLVESESGIPIAHVNVGAILPNDTLTWKQYGLLFSLPSNLDKIVVKIRLNDNEGIEDVGNDLAIDDITIRACMPNAEASFNKVLLQDSLSACLGEVVNLIAKTGSGNGYSTFWQISSDERETWKALLPQIDGNFAFTLPDTVPTYPLRFRLVITEAGQENNFKCAGYSNEIRAHIKTPPNVIANATRVCKDGEAVFTFESDSNFGPFTLEYHTDGQKHSKSGVFAGSLIQTGINVSESKVFRISKITDQTGCSHNMNIPISFNPQSAPSGSLSIETVCEGDSLFASFSATGFAPFSATIKINDTESTYQGLSNS